MGYKTIKSYYLFVLQITLQEVYILFYIFILYYKFM